MIGAFKAQIAGSDGIAAPLRHPTFRRIWLASVLSNLGILIQGVGAAWAMTNTASLNGKNPQVRLQDLVLPSESYGGTTFAARQKAGDIPLGNALGTTSENFLNANDDRMNQVVYVNGSLWSGLDTNYTDANAMNSSRFRPASKPVISLIACSR